MEHRTLTPDMAEYPAKLKARMADKAPILHCHGPLKLLDRFCLGVIASDNIPAECMLETNQLLFTIRDYALNYVGSWLSIMEMEIFRLSLDAPLDPRHIRSTTMLSSRGMEHETWDEYLDDRWGPEGPFRDFPQKPEYYRRAKEGELLVLSPAAPTLKKMTHANIMLKNLVVCALADMLFVPYADKPSKTFTTIKHALAINVPMFTVGVPKNNFLLDLGLPTYTRKTVGPFLESMGASRDGAPPFFKPQSPVWSAGECVPTSEHTQRAARKPVAQPALFDAPRRGGRYGRNI